MICNSEACKAVFKERSNLTFHDMAVLISSRAFGHTTDPHVTACRFRAERELL